MIQTLTLVVCYILGELLKLIFKEKLDTKWLPFIMAGIGLVLAPLITMTFTLERFAEGLVSGFASSGGYDAIKALTSKAKDIS